MANLGLSHRVNDDNAKWFTLIAVCFALFMAMLDNLVVNIALPTISRDLDATTSQLQWVISAYTLVFASLQITAGGLGDRAAGDQASALHPVEGGARHPLGERDVARCVGPVAARHQAGRPRRGQAREAAVVAARPRVGEDLQHGRPEGRAHALDMQAVRPVPAGHDRADGIGERRDLVEAGGRPVFIEADAFAVLEQIEGAIAYVDTLATRPGDAAFRRIRAALLSAHERLHGRMHRLGVAHRHTPLHRHEDPTEH